MHRIALCNIKLFMSRANDVDPRFGISSVVSSIELRNDLGTDLTPCAGDKYSHLALRQSLGDQLFHCPSLTGERPIRGRHHDSFSMYQVTVS